MIWVRLVSIVILIFPGIVVCAFAASEKQARTGAAHPPQATADMTTGSGNATGQSQLQQRNPRYALCKGDIFDLTFPFTPEFNQTVTVQPDGYITVTGLGDLYVAGKTVPETKELLQAAYGKTLHEPLINVVMKDFEKPYFIAGGEIARPGKYDMREDTTVTEAIAVAGGFTSNSKHSEVFVFRRVSNNWVEVKKLDVKKMFKAGNLSEDLHLQPGDMFFVPQNGISKFGKYIPNPGIGMTVTRY
ncbi:MAG: polysaccharide biosynthesis/export family protein [Bryobacteraceae bacterium]